MWMTLCVCFYKRCQKLRMALTLLYKCLTLHGLIKQFSCLTNYILQLTLIINIHIIGNNGYLIRWYFYTNCDCFILYTYDPPKSTTNNLCSNSYVNRVTPNWGEDLNTRAVRNKRIRCFEYIISNWIRDFALFVQVKIYYVQMASQSLPAYFLFEKRGRKDNMNNDGSYIL